MMARRKQNVRLRKMSIARILRAPNWALPCVALLLSLEARTARAEGTNEPARPCRPSLVLDISLQDGGVLFGQVVDAGGVAQQQADVWLTYEGQSVAPAKTDDAGRFLIRGLRGGLHEIHVAGQSSLVRLWAPGTEPPAARRVALIVCHKDFLVRGQDSPPDDDFKEILYGPFSVVTGAVIIGGLIHILDHNPPGS